MTSGLNKFKIMRKDNNWNSMSPKQEQIIALASIVRKLKDNNLKLSKRLKTSPLRKVKVKGNGKYEGKGQKPAGK